ncbi:metallothionein-I gene transcription activator [Plectosphaerella cucumerina]|uniref:Metallothionein-I gene transcription activator n=1 Tax=Plectosphaerella cucumerina TaxID=40658 RepID=A0A8K0TQH7_9PEZI|nr:metallothionein-I gene transcription activator [Plectosphaerella cucumerina]
MSREAYQVPTAGSQANPGATTRSYDAYSGGATSAGEVGPQMQYLCGDCGLRFSMRRGDAIRCKECGCRILYKERTKRMVQFEAR